MSSIGGVFGQQVVSALRAASEGLVCAGRAPVWQASDADVETAIELLDRVEAQAAGLRAALLVQADERSLRGRTGAPSTERWLVERFRWSRSRSAAALGTSRALTGQPALATALGDGTVTVEQAVAVSDALARIARVPGVTPAEQDDAAEFLVGQAAALGPKDLTVVVGRQLTETLTRLPSEDDPADEDALRREQERAEQEAQARERNRFRFSRARDGRCRATLELGPVGEAFARAWAKTAGRPAPGVDGFDDSREISERRGDALVDLLATAAVASTGTTAAGRPRAGNGLDNASDSVTVTAPDPAPGAAADRSDDAGAPADPDLFGPPAAGEETAAGDPAEASGRGGPLSPVALLTLTLSLAELRAGVTGAGLLETGATVSAATLRRLACDALVVPAVLGGQSEVLDLGRARRLHTPVQRRAIILRDRGCIAPGCHRPPRDCHIHHDPPWEQGGPTDTEHGYLTCDYHHHRIHQQGWSVRLAGNGRPELIPPKSIDPQQRPRQHTCYQLEPPRRC